MKGRTGFEEGVEERREGAGGEGGEGAGRREGHLVFVRFFFGPGMGGLGYGHAQGEVDV